MRSLDQFPKIYLYREPCDMRKQIARLSAMVQARMELDPFSEHLFNFSIEEET